MTPVEVSSIVPLKPLTEDSVVSLVVSINDRSFPFFPVNPHCCRIWVLIPLVHHHGSKMLRSESNSSITQSPIGWQISQILTQLHEPTGGMCVCTSECVPLVLVVPLCVRVCVSVHCEWRPPEPLISHQSLCSGFSCMQFSLWEHLRLLPGV